jgi:ectoine hydroxylase-related dioxygenase (phytanoyl-CoA dioxygenase family)
MTYGTRVQTTPSAARQLPTWTSTHRTRLPVPTAGIVKNGLMGRDMRLLWRDQPRVTLKLAVYLTDVESPDDGALEVVPRSHLELLGDQTVDPFYWASGELPLDARSTGFQEAA